MTVRVERKPHHLRSAVADGPQHGKTAEVVEAVGGIDEKEELRQVPFCVLRRRLRLLLPRLREQPGPLLRRSKLGVGPRDRIVVRRCRRRLGVARSTSSSVNFIPTSATGCSSTACTAPSIPVSSPAHSCLLP